MQPSTLPQGVTANTISFLLGHPDPSTLLTPEFRAAADRVMASTNAYQALEYGIEQGTPALIGFLIEKLNREQNLSLTGENVMLVAGSTAAVDMIARLHKRDGGVVLVEAPSYTDALHVFRDHGLPLYPIPMDEQGIRVDQLTARLEQLRAESDAPILIYTIPNFHNPTGVTLSAERRAAIAALAQRYNLLIVEDDVYRDLAFSGQAQPSLYTLSGGRALHIGSFSKTLAPGLRLGWLVGAGGIIERYVNCGAYQMGGGASPFPAQIVAEYCRAGHWESHIRHLRVIYRTRRDAMLAALKKHMPDGVSWTEPEGGFFIWMTLPDGCDAMDVKRRAQEHGVLVAFGGNFFVQPEQGSHNLRLTYSFAAPDDIETGIGILADLIQQES